MEKCIVLFSGGIDSTTALYWAINRYKSVCALMIEYGQLHRIELRMASHLTEKLHVPQKILHLNLEQIGGSSLTDPSLPLPEYRKIEEINEGVPSTYVPFRNGILLALAAAWAEVEGAQKIVCGFNAIDSPNYPDTRRPFVDAMEKAINCGTKTVYSREKIEILAPFIDMRKSDIIKEGLSHKADYSYSISCYSGEEIPCQKCSSCLIRQKAWEDVGHKDPLILRLEKEGKI